MSNYLVIADVGKALVEVLSQGMLENRAPGVNPSDTPTIVLQSPHGLADKMLSVFLYRVVENAHTKNQPTGLGKGGRVRKAPLTLELHFMITPHYDDANARHALLGRVMSILYDHPVLAVADPVDALGAAREEVRIVLNSVPLDEMARVWEALQESYQLSVCYIARVAILDSTIEQFITPVLGKRSRYGEPALAT